MSSHFPRAADDEIIDIGYPKRRRPLWLLWLVGALLLFVIAAARVVAIYVSALWFGSLGYSSVYWYILKLKVGLFVVFGLVTVLILRGVFWLLGRAFASYAMERRTITLNNQPFQVSPARLVRPLAWIVSLVSGFFFGLMMKGGWQKFALYFHQVATPARDPIFNKPVGFYLFSLPVYDLLSDWATAMAVIIFLAALVFSLLSIPQQALKVASATSRRTAFSVSSWALAFLLLTLAFSTYLSRFPYLWEDHQAFSGVTFTEANYLLPALRFVWIGLVIAAMIAVVNALTLRKLRPLIAAVALPLAVYVIGVAIVPAYVTSFIVKPNELGREEPYIKNNIIWTRRAFGLDAIEPREFKAENSIEALELGANSATLDNIRLWDWRALQPTLRQIQGNRDYYDFPDVDVDRYRIGGKLQQMMVAAREIDQAKLPEQSRNWINEKLIYTHGYGVTMNTSNGFDTGGMPHFVLSNMPIVPTSRDDVNVTRPEIYYGQKTDGAVYVRTRQKEFDYPQGAQGVLGESKSVTTYQGTGGIRIGSGLRRLVLAYELEDLSKLPFSDDITADSRVLIHRNIRDIVDSVAPFLIYDNDPYSVVGADGGLYWIIDAYTESSSYPYSRHYTAAGNSVNYMRNSVKAVIDAYNGSVRFYVFDADDPLLATYRATFPALFHDKTEMPPDLLVHVRYPETLMKTQAEVFGLYHTEEPKIFFPQEDLWSIATQVGLDDQNKSQVQAVDPYYVLMQLPQEQPGNEFALILPFTPSKRNNMIGWMAGRCDGDNYGKLLVYSFPKSRTIDGPLQIEARIDQNADISKDFTLWNQNGSHVVRGHLLVIPIGRSLLYVEPVYLKADNSAMPSLKKVILANQDRIGYGDDFKDALAKLLGGAPLPADNKTTGSQKEGPPAAAAAAQPSPSPAGTTAQATQLIMRAIQEFEDYQRLTAQGKLAEAGQKLEQHKRTLEELKKLSVKQ